VLFRSVHTGAYRYILELTVLQLKAVGNMG
jgi:hypothetical protein